TCTRALHTRADNGLRGRLGDARSNRVMSPRRLGVLHPAGGVLVRDVADRRLDLFTAARGVGGSDASTHRTKDVARAVVMFLYRLAPRGRQDARLRRVFAFERVGRLSQVLDGVESIYEVHCMAGESLREVALDRREGCPLRSRAIAGEHHIDVGTFIHYGEQL